jgi:hypothetical protein
MRSFWRVIVVGTAVAGALGVGIPGVSAQAADPRVGTWKLNVAKSKYSPGPPPQSQTLKVEAAGKGEKVISEQVTGDGKTIKTEYTANFDGKDSPITGALNSDTVALKRINARTTDRTDKKDGKVTLRFHRVVAADGKTMTVTIKGKDAQGRDVNNTVVFEKQ